jgi:kynurenine---oxoglutarate transaminase / cysteine-S-conjugate beta-lyase / glutamine---phenylpyruvate transaminase
MLLQMTTKSFEKKHRFVVLSFQLLKTCAVSFLLASTITSFSVSVFTTKANVNHVHTKLFLSERVNEEGIEVVETTIISKSKVAQIISNGRVAGDVCVGQATQRLGGISTKPTVWTEFSRIAAEKGPTACNLGQGFPDWAPPQFAIDSLVEASQSLSHHQYTRPAGHPDLVKQLARRYSLHLHRTIDPFSEVAVTVGASQALYLCLQTLIEPGDEVILFEPFFDLYVNQVKLAGGTPVFVPLDFVPYTEVGQITGGTWVLNPETLKAKVSPTKTKAIILNSPHNPTGKVFTRAEMEYVAESLELSHPDCVVLSDEVYKYIVHAPPKQDNESYSLHCTGHVHFASLPGMWSKTITISSAGKTFSATGWQIGWCVGPKHLIARTHQLLPYVQFCASTIMQEALARTLTKADMPYKGFDSYYDYLRNMYTLKRDLLGAALSKAGFAIPDYTKTPGGGFFIFARVSKAIADMIPSDRLLALSEAAPSGIARQDWALCQWLAEEHGLICIPSSPFFSEESTAAGASDSFIRIAFCKTDETIEKASEILIALQQSTVLEPAIEVPLETKIKIAKQ